MSPEQLITLKNLSQLFKDGVAGPDQIKQLSELLALINNHTIPIEQDTFEGLTDRNSHI
ncbi:hypothetical protein AADZ91_00055 [Colwelliaceae bacterium 6441]